MAREPILIAVLSGHNIIAIPCPSCGALGGRSCGDLTLPDYLQPSVFTREGWMHWERVYKVVNIHHRMTFRTPHVAEQLRTFVAIVADAQAWTAIGADAEYGVVLSGDAKSFPIVHAWMDESEWRLEGFKGFRPSRDRETALIIGDALSLACATLASLFIDLDEIRRRIARSITEEQAERLVSSLTVDQVTTIGQLVERLVSSLTVDQVTTIGQLVKR